LARPLRADFPGVDARLVARPTDPAGSLFLEPAATPGPGAWNGSAWLTYAYRPAVLRDGSGAVATRLVSHQLSADLVANVGIGERFAVGAFVPVLVVQTGDDGPEAQASGASAPDAQAIGDVGIVAKANVLKSGALGGFGLSALARLTAPTGPERSYLGAGTPTTELRALAEYKLIALAVQATAGVKVRFEERDVLGATYGHELPWGVALSVRPQAFGWDEKGRFTWVAEVHGSAFLPPSSAARARGQETPVAPVLAGLSARMGLGDLSVLLGAETSLTRALGGSPLQVTASLTFAPRAHDMDHDGVNDDVDQCPELPEDRDGFEDADGCPDWDNDDDGVGDAQDRCPGQKEDENGYQDDDGCPDRVPAKRETPKP
jgi:OOP family OmpA-OmpF porin